MAGEIVMELHLWQEVAPYSESFEHDLFVPLLKFLPIKSYRAVKRLSNLCFRFKRN